MLGDGHISTFKWYTCSFWSCCRFCHFQFTFSGLSSLLGAINFLITIYNMRVPDFQWDNYLYSYGYFHYIHTITIIASCTRSRITMLLTDRNFNTTFFDPSGEGIPYYISIYSDFRSSGSIYSNYTFIWSY